MDEWSNWPILINNPQGRQLVPKSGRSERGRKRNFGVYQTTAPNNLLLKGYFYLEFSGRGRKSGSAYALVDLVTLAPLKINQYKKVFLFQDGQFFFQDFMML